MKSRLVIGLEPLEADETERAYLSSQRLRARMIDLLKKDIDTIHTSMRDEKGMDTSAWPYVQATKLGEVRALLKIISLLE